MLLGRNLAIMTRLALTLSGLVCAGCPLFLEDDFRSLEEANGGSGNGFDGPRGPGGGGADSLGFGGSGPTGPSSFGDPNSGSFGLDLDPCSGAYSCEQYSGNNYRLCTDALPADEAARDCERFGGELVSIDSADLNDWLSSTFRDMGIQQVWTSGSDAADEGRWVWANGEAYYGASAPAGAYEAWARGEPNDQNGQDCMAIDTASSAWNDFDCDDNRAYACILP